MNAQGNILDVLYKSVLKFLVPLTPLETYSIIVQEAIKLVGGDEGVIYLSVDGELQNVYSSSKTNPKDIRSNGYTHTSFSQRKAFVINSNAIKKVQPSLFKKGIRSSLFIPLYYKNKSFGVLVVRSLKSNKHFSNQELDTLKVFGSLASLAIRKMQLYDETSRALAMRNQFIALAAHELRTPLTSIHGYIQLLQNKSSSSLLETKWINNMYSESMKLMNLINELIEVNHIEAGRQIYNFSEVDLLSVCEQAIKRLSDAYPKQKIKFKFSPKTSLKVIGDKEKLFQVVFSLLDNAAKFSSFDKEINLELKSKQNNIAIVIKDKGRGIAKEDLPKIFEGFYKGENNQVVGMGVGLLLAKTVIEKHHGKITISSKLKSGTIVRIILPKIRYD